MPLSDAQRRLRRSKQSERDLGHWLQEYDGIDPEFAGIASSTGRVGHVLMFDVISKTYAAENKQVRLNKNFLGWWLQIIEQAAMRKKEVLLSIEPSNVLATPEGKKVKIPRMHILTADRHAALLRLERACETCEECSVRRALG